MSRARATALALVNWKGVFYERYLLDRHVTALEGANGAGKTTVMIAAYIVLLPDLSRLKFTNVGESSAAGGDKGIWGRLGDLGRPSYAVLEFELALGKRIIAGVELERKAEPTLQLTPFVISGLDLAGGLKELLLLQNSESEQVPELSELKESVTRLGGNISVFQTTKDYFAALFELGITPLRLSTEEERGKLNEMLRTSMTGGISRALTSELRSFLLKEETGLSDALSRMRGNLDACHRTRLEVSEARNLEHEITGVYDAVQFMLAAALLSVRERHAELKDRAQHLRRAHELANLRLTELDQAKLSFVLQTEALAGRLQAAKAACEAALEHQNKVQRASVLAADLATLATELATRRAHADQHKSELEVCAQKRTAKKQERDAARAAYDRAARGLGDFQAGLDELHRRAHAFRHARTTLDEARQILGMPALAEAEIEQVRLNVDQERMALDVSLSNSDRELSSSALKRAEYDQAWQALQRILGKPPEAPEHEQARLVLSQLAGLEAAAARTDEMRKELAQLQERVERQKRVRTRAEQLQVSASVSDGGEQSKQVQVRLNQVEAELRALEEEAQQAEARALESHNQLLELRKHSKNLENRALFWQENRTLSERLETLLHVEVKNQQGVLTARARLLEAREQQRRKEQEQSQARETALAEAAALSAKGGVFAPDLLRMRDEVDGELLALRFEELEQDEARRLEAVLGPLADALIVEDPERAAKLLVGKGRDIAEVRLIQAHSAPEWTPQHELSEMFGDDLVIHEPYGLRISRMPKQPFLGRHARELKAQGLRDTAARLDAELERSRAELRATEGWLRDADTLLAQLSYLEAGDPAPEIAATAAAIEQSEQLEKECRSRGFSAKSRALALKPEYDGLRALLSEAFILDEVGLMERASELGQRLQLAEIAEHELARSQADRRVLSQLLDALRTAPKSAAELERQRAHDATRKLRRDQLFVAAERLSEALRQRAALAWVDAEQALAEQSSVMPALEAQLASAKATAFDLEAEVSASEVAWEAAAEQSQKAEAEWQACDAQRERLEAEIAAQNLGDLTSHALDAAKRRVRERETERSQVEQEERALLTELALVDERRLHAARAAEEAHAARARGDAEAEPAQAHWLKLRDLAEQTGALKSCFVPRIVEAYMGRGSLNLWPEARGKADLLSDRLTAAKGGADAAKQVREMLQDSQEVSGESYLNVWLLVRDWLKRRLPSQVVEIEDPLEALARLRDNLATLESRLFRQETDLRGASEDVARGIDVQLRRANGQVRRLNQNLDGVKFGSIAGIRVQSKRIERMDQVLAALREGHAQELLFQPNMPIEAALDEIFRRYGGGRSTGQRILDYREYVELSVEIQRQADAAWEAASPARLSTGEAIGVGAALMMVVLTEWERDANLLRAKRGSGSLRFLFLDEANRLSHDNLGVLFDLCKNLDLQLLIAAPEVARAEGNTTYRLVRRVDEAGKEEVLVSGRRTVTDAN